MVSRVNVRSYRDEDINLPLKLTSEERWSFSEIDCRASLKVDPEGLLVAEDETGVPVGFIGLFNMSADITYVNAFIVRKDLRGKGIGKKLWTAMLKTKKDNILALDGVSYMKEWYIKQGFSFEAYCAKTYRGTILSDEYESLPHSCNIVPLSDDLWSALNAYDKQVYTYSREHVLRAWFYGANRYSVVALLENSIVGYANYHWKSQTECNIRALYADNSVITEALLLNLLRNIPVGSVVCFVLLADKPLPKYFSNCKSSGAENRLITKEISGIQTNKIILNTAHTI